MSKKPTHKWNLTPNQRWEQGIPHHPESAKIFKDLDKLDFKYGDVFGFKSGGDGDNGEHLMYLLDMIYERRESKKANG